MAKIYTAAGHGGRDSGAIGCGFVEKNLTLEVTLQLNAFLVNAGHTVSTYRTIDTDYGLNSSQRVNQVVKKANDFKADYCIDVHFNAYTDATAKGVECYYSKFEKATTPGYLIADNCCKTISTRFGLVNRGPKLRLTLIKTDYFGVIRDTIMPANLVECSFITNPEDMLRYNAREIARQIAISICKVLGGTVPEFDAPPIPSVQKDLAKVENNKIFAMDASGTPISDSELKVKTNNKGEIIFYK